MLVKQAADADVGVRVGRAGLVGGGGVGGWGWWVVGWVGGVGGWGGVHACVPTTRTALSSVTSVMPQSHQRSIVGLPHVSGDGLRARNQPIGAQSDTPHTQPPTTQLVVPQCPRTQPRATSPFAYPHSQLNCDMSMWLGVKLSAFV